MLIIIMIIFLFFNFFENFKKVEMMLHKHQMKRINSNRNAYKSKA